MRLSLQLAALAVLCAPLVAWAGRPQPAAHSVYTTLDVRTCRLLSSDEETGSTLHQCRGVAGYRLQVADDDARMSVSVVPPGGGVHRLHYWTVVGSGFSTLGPRAEWRMRGQGTRARPVALIVRVEVSDPEQRVTSYLAVARVSPRASCVTEVIRPAANMNELARRAADRSAGRPCLRT
ncbi:MAG TPA: hypothetical protein VF613_03975 [Longimicrobium sp.]|jgi:hypothetical protein